MWTLFNTEHLRMSSTVRLFSRKRPAAVLELETARFCSAIYCIIAPRLSAERPRRSEMSRR